MSARSLLLLIVLAALWGGSFVFTRFVVPVLGPFPLTCTEAIPLSCLGVWNTICESEAETGAIAAPSSVSLVPVKPAPVSLTEVPPAIGPCAGLIESIRA